MRSTIFSANKDFSCDCKCHERIRLEENPFTEIGFKIEVIGDIKEHGLQIDAIQKDLAHLRPHLRNIIREELKWLRGNV